MQAQKARGAVRCTITALAVQEERVTASAAKLGITINMYAFFSLVRFRVFSILFVV
jgi:hypothetical protein